jgi:hypothetical protein
VHVPNLKTIQYYFVLELEINEDARELRVEEIVEVSLVAV